MQRSLIICALAVALAVALARTASAQSIDEARLGTAAAEVRALVDDARRVGLPAELLVAKVREGVAKGVPPARIVSEVRGLAAALANARSDAQPFVGATPPLSIVRALVAARTAGASAADTIAVLRANGRERALAVLTELLLRGYPTPAATHVVTSLAGRERALDELVAQAERLRSRNGAAPVDVLVALAHGNGQPWGLEHGEANPHAAEQISDDDGRGPNRESSGARGPRSGGVAPPGKGRP